MTETKTRQIEAINVKIIALMLDRARIQRYKGTWDEEQKITDEIMALEAEIRAIRNAT